MQTNETHAVAEEATKSSDVQKEHPADAQPQKEHEWLHKLLGEWTCVTEAAMAPGQPPAKFESREVVRSLGGLWIVAEGTGEMPGGGTMNTVMTLGYDPEKGRFVGTFIASMMTHMWIYNGTLDSDRTVLTLDTEGPSMSAAAGSTMYKDVIEIKADDHRTLTSHMLGEDGQWQKVMTAQYRRRR